MKDKKILRIIDANLNRLLEGLRVGEEILRFIFCAKAQTMEFKRLRHQIIKLVKEWGLSDRALLESREASKDAGRVSLESELKRNSLADIFFANIQRAKESVRVLEEFSKLDKREVAQGFKKIRYQIYQLEKKTAAGF